MRELVDSGSYKLSEMSEITGVPLSSLRKWATNGQLRASKAGRDWRLSGAAIRHFLEHGTEPKRGKEDAQ